MDHKIKVEYAVSGNRTKELLFKKTNYFCPFCGSNEHMYNDITGPGDYYDGTVTYCLKCNSAHYLDNSAPINDFCKIPATELKKNIGLK